MSIRLLNVADFEMIPDEMFPFLVLTDNLSSWLSWKIKNHSHGFYSHSMWMTRNGIVATQGWMYKEQSIYDFLKGNHRVKLWFSPDWGTLDRARIKRRINERLAETKRALRYDWIGIIGQALGFRKLNLKGRSYCSEESASVLAVVEPFGIEHPTPADLDAWCREHEQMAVYGVYDPSLI
uniref:Uncharacterized protein n=1 Tax=viral metagenome TaxID=1070528 RepID=A0A6M3IZI7_9ZZZZ